MCQEKPIENIMTEFKIKEYNDNAYKSNKF